METSLVRSVRADPHVLFSLAAAVEDWPAILPHYRRVRVLHDSGSVRTIQMAAWRDAIPVAWTAEQQIDPNKSTITFHHIRGATRGMRVAWTFTSIHDGLVQVRIWHGFSPQWPLVPDSLVHAVIGKFFVDHIAGLTLDRIATLAEQRTAVYQ